MARRTPIEDRPALAQWLIRTRKAHGLSAVKFLEAMGEGAPNYTTYALWESGTTGDPNADSLEPVFAYWESRGVTRYQRPAATGSSLSPEQETLELLREQVRQQTRQADALEGILNVLRGGTVPWSDPAVVASLAAAQAGAQSPLHAQDPLPDKA